MSSNLILSAFFIFKVEQTSFDELLKKINYKFKDIGILKQALTHPSYASKMNIPDNERLEFLGDSIIGFIITKKLFEEFPNYDEGLLTKIKGKLCSRKNLNKKAKSLELEKFILIDEKIKNQNSKDFLGNAYESLIGAIYVDGKLKVVERIINKMFSTDFKSIKRKIKQKINIEDPKSYLQEEIQKKYKILPEYKVIKETGKQHNKTFYVELSIPDGKFIGKGKSKKDAEINAAKKAIKKLNLKF